MQIDYTTTIADINKTPALAALLDRFSLFLIPYQHNTGRRRYLAHIRIAGGAQ